MNLTSLDRRVVTGTCAVALVCVVVLFGVSYTLLVLTVTVVLVLLFLYDLHSREEESYKYFNLSISSRREIAGRVRFAENSISSNKASTVYNSIKKAFSETLLSPSKSFNNINSTTRTSRSTFDRSHRSLRDPARDTMASPFFKRGTVDRNSSKRRLSGVSIGSNSTKHSVPLVAVGSPLSPHAFLRSPSIATPALPRVRRVNSENIGRYDLRNASSPAKSYGSPGVGLFPHSSSGGHGDYPTHLPQYNGLGILPKVHLHPVDKPLLTEHNNRLSSPVTVKIAPPDILKPPTPCVVIPEYPEETHNEENKAPERNGSQEISDTVREKRKRTLRDDEDEAQRGIIPPVQQDAKRRRFHEETMVSKPATNGHSSTKDSTKRSAAEAVKNFLQRLTGRKRKPPVEPDESILTEDEDEPLRERHEAPQTKKIRSEGPKMSSMSVGSPRNAIDVSYSSSRMFREDRSLGSRTRQSSWSTTASRERSGAPSRESSVPPGSAASSQATEKSLPPSGTSTPRRALGLDDDDEDVTMLPATSSTPVLDKSDKEEKEKEKVKVRSSRSLFPSKKTGTLKLRSTLIKGDTITDFSKVPTMQYEVTSEDYAQDRQADLERVRKMLENPEKKDSTDGKSSQPQASGSSALGKPTLASSLSSSATLPVSAPPGPTSSSASISSLPPLVVASPLNSVSDAGVSSTEVTSTQSTSALSVSQTKVTAEVKATSSLPTINVSAAKPDGFKVPLTSANASARSEAALVTSAEPSKTETTPSSSVVTTLFSFKPVFATAIAGMSPNAKTSSSTTNINVGHPVSFPASTVVTDSKESKDGVKPPSYSAAISGSAISVNSALTSPVTSISAPLSSTGGFNFKAVSSSTSAPDVTPTGPPVYGFGQKQMSSGSVAASGDSSTNALASGLSSSGPSGAGSGLSSLGSQPPYSSFASSNNSEKSLGGASSTGLASAAFAFGTTTTANASTKTTLPSASPFTFGATAPATTVANVANAANASTFTFGAAKTTPGLGTITTTSSSSGTSAFTFGANTNATSAPSATPAFGIGATSTINSSAPAFTFGASNAPPASTTPAFGTGTTATPSSASSAFTFGASAPTTTSSGFAFKAAAPSTGPFGGVSGQTSTPFGSTNSAAATTATTNSAVSFGNIASTNLKPAAPGGSITFGTSTATTSASSSPFNFGAQTNKPAASTGLNFGTPATTQAPSSGSAFAFGGGSNTNTSTNNPSSFTFGANAQNTNVAAFGSTAATTSSTFAFGGSQTTAAPSNAFATASMTSSMTSSTNAPSKAFEFGKPSTQNSGFNFGGNQPAPTASPFGQANTSNAFGSSGSASTPFGSAPSAAPAFGSFGSNATATPSKGFDFSGSAAGQNSSFNFGQSPSIQFGSTTPAPAASPFGSTPFNSNNNSSPAPSSGEGMFSMGSGNTQARLRPMRTARRRAGKPTKR